jgi:hypothetical protein
VHHCEAVKVYSRITDAVFIALLNGGNFAVGLQV